MKIKSVGGNLKCSYCGYFGNNRHNYSNCPAQGHIYRKCGKSNHFEDVCRTSKGTHNKEISAVIISTIDLVISSCNVLNPSHTKRPELTILMHTELNTSAVPIKCLADTGAQVTVANEEHMKLLQIRKEQLKKTPHTPRHAGGRSLHVLGSYPVILQHNHKPITREMYFVSGAPNLYLSFNVCKELSLVHKNFPDINITAVQNEKSPDNITLPERPSEPPYAPTENNIMNLQAWLLNAFSASTFNVVSYPLPLMQGKPQRIYSCPEAIQYASHSPIPIPHNWKT